MFIRPLILSLVLAFGATGVAQAQSLVVTQGSSGPAKLELGYGIAVNKNSTLQREWRIINDQSLPLQIEKGAAVPIYHNEQRSRGEYRYSAPYTVKARDKGVTAFEVRFLVLDVFGQRQRLLSSSELVDIAAQGQYDDTAQWRLWSEADASTAFYSIAYVAAVRTIDGQIHRANNAEVLKAIQKISSTITADDIKPEKEERK